MSATAAVEVDGGKAPSAGKRRKLLLLLAVLALLAGGGAALWLSGLLPGLMGSSKPTAEEVAKPLPRPALVFVELPEMVANLNVGARRASFIKLKSRLELTRTEDQAIVQAAMPRLVDLFQTYLREMRPEELRGSAGTYRLREELISRANLAAHPARVVDVLFTELLVQ